MMSDHQIYMVIFARRLIRHCTDLLERLALMDQNTISNEDWQTPAALIKSNAANFAVNAKWQRIAEEAMKEASE